MLRNLMLDLLEDGRSLSDSTLDQCMLQFCSLCCLYNFSDLRDRERTTQPAENVMWANKMACASLSMKERERENPTSLPLRTGTAEKTKTQAHAEQQGAQPSPSLWKQPGHTAHSHCCTPNHCNMPSGTYAHSPQGWNKLCAQGLLPATTL